MSGPRSHPDSPLKAGWHFARKQPGWLWLLGLYLLLWGGIGYRWIQSFFAGFLSRYPGAELGDLPGQVFWAEIQFRIMKANALEPWLWLIGGILLLRMICHPLLYAGVMHTLMEHAAGIPTSQRTLFRSLREGIRKLGAIFSLYYFLQLLAVTLPLFWLVPRILSTLQTTLAAAPVLEQHVVELAAYVLYTWIVRAVILYVMIKKTQSLSSDSKGLRLKGIFHLFKVVSLSVLFVVAVTLLSLGFGAYALVWPGLAAIGLHLLFGFLRAGMLLWELSACYKSSES